MTGNISSEATGNEPVCLGQQVGVRVITHPGQRASRFGQANPFRHFKHIRQDRRQSHRWVKIIVGLGYRAGPILSGSNIQIEIILVGELGRSIDGLQLPLHRFHCLQQRAGIRKIVFVVIGQPVGRRFALPASPVQQGRTQVIGYFQVPGDIVVPIQQQVKIPFRYKIVFLRVIAPRLTRIVYRIVGITGSVEIIVAVGACPSLYIQPVCELVLQRQQAKDTSPVLIPMGIVHRPVRIHDHGVGTRPENRRFHTGDIHCFVILQVRLVHRRGDTVYISGDEAIAAYARFIVNILHDIGQLRVRRQPVGDVDAKSGIEGIPHQPVARYDTRGIVIGIGKIGLQFVRPGRHTDGIIGRYSRTVKIPDIVGKCLQIHRLASPVCHRLARDLRSPAIAGPRIVRSIGSLAILILQLGDTKSPVRRNA